MSVPSQQSIIAALLSILIGGAAASAADDEAVQPFALTELSGHLDLETEALREQRGRAGADTNFKSERVQLKEELRINVRGFAYHPRFLTYDGGVSIRFIQSLVESGDKDFAEGANASFGGDWRLTFLREHPYSFIQHGKVEQRQVERSFARDFELTSELYGASLISRAGRLPFTLRYDHRSNKGSGSGADVDDVSDDFTARAAYSRGRRLRGDLEYRFIDQDIRGTEQTRHELVARQSVDFDNKKHKRLRSTLRLQRHSDTIDRFAGFAFVNFDWRHSDKLQTHYRSDFQHNDSDTQTSTNLNLATSLRHQLYDNLFTEPDVYVRLTDASFGDNYTFGVGLFEDYSRRLQDWGRLRLGLRPRFEFTQNRPLEEDSSGQPLPLSIEVIDEAHTFSGSTPIELRNRNVDRDSIVVSDSSGAPTFDEGSDYVVIVRGIITEIRRLPAGDITDDGKVVVDYEYRPTGRSDILTTMFSANAELFLFDGVLLFARYSSSDQSLESGTISTELEERDLFAVGARYDLPWLSLNTEFENQDSTFSSFRAFSQRMSLFTPSWQQLRGRASASHRYQEYTDSDERLRQFAISFGLDGRLIARSTFKIEGEYRREDWQGELTGALNDLEAIGARAELLWPYNDFELRIGGRISRVDRELSNNEDSDRVFIRMRRKF